MCASAPTLRLNSHPNPGTLRSFPARDTSPRRLPAHYARADGLCARLFRLCACSLALRRDRPGSSSLPARVLEACHITLFEIRARAPAAGLADGAAAASSGIGLTDGPRRLADGQPPRTGPLRRGCPPCVVYCTHRSSTSTARAASGVAGGEGGADAVGGGVERADRCSRALLCGVCMCVDRHA